MTKNRTYFLSIEQIQNGIKLCKRKINQILSDVEILCNNGGDETTSVFLFTIAIEEFGKLLLLKQSLSNPSTKKGIPISLDLFQGVEGHSMKIQEALDKLPEECQIYQDVDMLSQAHKIPNEYRKYVRNAPKLQEKLRKLEKQFPNARFDVGTFAVPFDFATRKTLLYVNWDAEHKRWNDDIAIDPYKIIEDDHGSEREVEKDEEEVFPEKLLNAIDSFRDTLESL